MRLAIARNTVLPDTFTAAALEMDRLLKLARTNEGGVDAIALTIGDHELILHGDDAEDLLKRLALVRAAMKPAVPPVISRTHPYVLEMNPSWHAEPHPQGQGIVLLFRHSGYGWTGSQIPEAQISGLLSLIADYLKSPEHPPMLAN